MTDSMRTAALRPGQARTQARAPLRRSLLLLFLLLMVCLLAPACHGGSAPGPTPGPGTDPGLPPSGQDQQACPALSDTLPVLPLPLPRGDTVRAGTLPGAFSVSSTGEAHYTLPLVVPPGRAGMEPTLSLTYDSAAGDGVLGMGFALTGLSAITRCPRTMAQDQVIRAVRDDEDDAFCLDGKRLISTGGPPEAREYRTFPDTFTRVVAQAPGGWDFKKGPQSFRAFTRAGLVLDYGASPSGQVLAKKGVIHAWWVTQAADRSENTIAYSYVNHKDSNEGYTSEHAPLRIDYTGHPSAPASRAVVFEYGGKMLADARVVYSRGLELHSSLRLQRVHMLGPWENLVQEYRFDYSDPGPATGRTRLSAVEECAADGVCKPPTRFGWSGSASPGFRESNTAIPMPESKLASIMPMDVTGDGLDDLVIADVDMLGGSENHLTDWLIVPNESAADATAFAAQSALAFQEEHPDDGSAPAEPVQPELGTPIDYDHDGRMDVLLHDVYGYFQNWHVLLARPNNHFKLLNTHIPRIFGVGAVPPRHLSSHDASAHLADVDGDGVADLLQCASNGVDHSWFWHRWRPEGPGFDPAPQSIDALQIYPCNAELHPVDIDSDGKVDLVVQALFENNGATLQGVTYVALSLVDPAANTWELVDTKLPIAPIGPRGGVIFLDVNGDGLPDALETGFQDRQPRTFLSSGEGFLAPSLSLWSPVPDADQLIKLAVPLDYNGDGRQDLLVPLPSPGALPSWVILQSQGEQNGGTFLLVDPGIPFEAELKEDGVTIADPHGPRVLDADGDGAQDVLLGLNKQIHLFKNSLGDQDLLITVTDGLNARNPGAPGLVPNVQISYAHLVDRSITQGQAPDGAQAEAHTYLSREDEAKGCAYPLRCVVGPRRVVSGYAIDKGGASPRSFSLAYRDGRAHHLGRGFLGFGARLLRDLDTGAGTVERYDNTTFDPDLRAYPLVGEIAHRWTYNPGRPGEPDPQRIELSFFDALTETVKTQGGKSYFTLPILRRTRREQGTFPPSSGSTLTVLQYVRATADSDATVLGDTQNLVADYDLFGNIKAESTHTAGVDLTFQVTRSFTNDEDSWLLGLPTTQTECSSAAGISQCRTDKRTYNDRGKVITETTDGDAEDPAETHLALTFTYDVFGNITATTADDAFGGHRLSCTYYDQKGIFPRAQRNPAGHLSQFRFDAGLGVRTVATDPNGFSTRWAYDGFGRITEEQRPDGTKTTYTRTRTQEPTTGWTVWLESKTDGLEDDTVEYDSLGRAVRWWSQGVQTGALPAPRVKQEIGFDALGEHVARRSVPASEATPPGALLYDEYRHDSAGRLLRHTTPWQGLTDYSYDGAKVRVRDPLGFVTTIENDGLGRPVSITDTSHGETLYTYGPFGGLRTVTDPGGAVTTTERDTYGRIKEQHDPDRGKSTHHYDGFGLPRWSLDAKGRKVSFSHDALGRRIGRSDQDGTSGWLWDKGAHGIGKLSKVFGPDGTEETYTYGAFGRLEGTHLTLDGETLSATLEYDAHGLVSKLSYPQGDGIEPLAVHPTYDPHGHLLTVRDASTDLPYWTLVEADGAGRTHVEQLGASLTTTREYFDAKNRVKSIATTGLAGPVQALSYDYDIKLNLTRRTDALQQGKTEFFKYDPLDRLTCASLQNDFSCADPLTYLPNGNIDHKPGVGDYWYSQNHPHAVRSAGDAKYDYDAVGNQIERPGATVEYNALDLPRRFTRVPSGRTVDFSYDGDGHRVRKSAGGTTTVYFGDLYERTTDSNTGLVEHRHSIHAAERAIAVVTRSPGAPSKTVYLHADHLGSTDALTSEAGVVQEQRSYDAFGARRSPVWGQAAIPPPSQAVP